ncbi:MAG: D-alanyl-D-alanine carboxypeptidase/D-alanyl-D-alanine-endopeptidase [Ignavibacteriales bacterium]|nr:D-alanyl-D-alanine carboxypeptidase/D-alanyl-D-alanine-endopeptidase [Ignavibacteriales bacterium]
MVFAQEAKSDSLPKFTFATIPEFQDQLEDIFDDPSFNSAQWGVVIQSMANGEYLYKRNEHKLLMPASNLKLITTAAALHYLGKNYRFKTEIYTIGDVEGNRLKGDLIIRGFGDPAISGRFYNDSILKVFNNWADSLLENGIDEIDGNIIGDDNAFDDIGLGSGWAWDYETDWYAAPSGALSLNDNCIELLITPGNAGEKAKMEMEPLTRYVTIIYNVYTVAADSVTDISVYRQRGTNIISISGTIKENSDPKRLYASINNPTQYFVTVFKVVLLSKGIKIKGYAADIDDLVESPDLTKEHLLFTHYSAFLPVILSIVNKNSQNFFAEQLLKAIGYEKDHFGTTNNGLSYVEKFLSAIGVNTENIQLVDGSGLSRMNLLTARQLSTVLGFMYKQDYFSYYLNSLSVAGKSGSLSDRMLKSRAENNVRGKTGYVGNVRSLSGYMLTGDNEWVSFVMIVNNFTVPFKLADNIQDLVCIRLANFKRK